MSDYLQATAYLDSFVDYEQKVFFPYRHTFKLVRVHALIHTLAIAIEKLAVLHIAGTKGKGSTAAFCAYMLASTGARVGLYTSPHFFDFRERIQILKRAEHEGRGVKDGGGAVHSPQSIVHSAQGDKIIPHCRTDAMHSTKDEGRKEIVSEMITQREVVRLVREMQPALERLRHNPQLGKLSFFEVYTALAFMYFLEKKVDYVVLETGLGGRLDATNVARPLISIITRIGLDHTDKLGATLARIAYEKAGIIKRNTPLVSAPQSATVTSLLEQRARALGAPLFMCARDFHASNVTYHKNLTTFDFSFGTNRMPRCAIALAGSHQVENAGLALAAIELLRRKRLSTGDDAVKAGLRAAYIAGRFEILRRRPLVVGDIAHNPLAFETLSKNLKLYFPDRNIILIFAASRDKDVRNMINKIKSRHIILTSFDNPRSYAPLEIKALCQRKDACCVSSVAHAYPVAARIADSHSLILISGSLFLVAEAKKFLTSVV
ncbi:MAG: hypothetical protein KKF80_05485 [Candidatus Omnitrophica bacterium]|nr:hypothetical protein [Candidatus Omnitrophota bacterium]